MTDQQLAAAFEEAVAQAVTAQQQAVSALEEGWSASAKTQLEAPDITTGLVG